MIGAGHSPFDPAGVVLSEKLPGSARSVPVGLGIVPAIEQIAAFAASDGGLFRAGAVVDDPDLVEFAHAE